MANRPKARSEQLLVQRTGQETLIYDERSHRAHCLDARATRVWELCDGARSESEIALAYGEGDAGRAVVIWTIAELEKSALLEGSADAARAALSRRALMRTVGLAAIPVIVVSGSGEVLPKEFPLVAKPCKPETLIRAVESSWRKAS